MIIRRKLFSVPQEKGTEQREYNESLYGFSKRQEQSKGGVAAKNRKAWKGKMSEPGVVIPKEFRGKSNYTSLAEEVKSVKGDQAFNLKMDAIDHNMRKAVDNLNKADSSVRKEINDFLSKKGGQKSPAEPATKSINRLAHKKAGTSGVSIPKQVWKENEGMGVKNVPTKDKFRFTVEDARNASKRGRIKYNPSKKIAEKVEGVAEKESGSLLKKMTGAIKNNPKTAIGIGAALAAGTGLGIGRAINRRNRDKK